MLSQLRAFAKSPLAVALLSILLISFAIWGIQDVFRSAGSRDAVIQAGSRTVDSVRFRKFVENWLAQYQQQTGQNVALPDLLKAGVDHQLAEGFATEEAFAAYLTRIGIRPADALVAKALQQFTGFFNPVTGQFDRNAYLSRLRENNITPQDFEAELRDDIAQQQFTAGFIGGLRAPLIYAAIPAAYETEGRSFAWFTVGPQVAGPAPKPTDADLTKFMQENADQLRRPEARVLTVVRFSAAQLAPTLPVDQTAVQKRFDFEKDALSQPEKRSLVQITVTDPKRAGEVAARLKRGEDPAAVAKSVGASPLVLSDVPKSSIADRKVADAAFSLQPGETSGVIQGDLGTAVVKVTKVTPGHTVTLQEERPKIEDEVRKAEAEDRVYKQVQKFEDARNGGASLADAAKAAGVQPVTLPPVTAKGTDLQGHPVPLPPKLLQTAFAQQAGTDGDVQNLDKGEYYAIRVEKALPPSLPPLAEIRPQLAMIWTMREQAKRVQDKANALADQIRQGKPLPAVAASLGATPGNAVDIRRGQAGQTFSKDFLGRMFNARKPGEVVVGEDAKAGFVVGRLEAVVPGTPAEIAKDAVALRDSTSRGIAGELDQAAHVAARKIVKPKIDYARARAALGGEQGAGQAQ